MSMFSFDLDESFELIRKITPVHTQDAGFSLWKKAVLSNKGYLIEAIDPKTGRKDYEVANHSALSAIQAIAQINNICGYLTNINTGYGESISLHLSHADVTAQAIQADSPALAATPKVKKGMKLTRAISAILHEVYGLTESHASYRVSCITDNVFSPPYKKFTISANPLDILMCSEHASFTSCHRFGGEYRGGPIHYAQDHFTIVAYVWKEARTYSPHNRTLYGEAPKLPYKVWRQLIFVDVPNRSLAFMRSYGSLSIPAPAHRAIRQQAGRLLHKLCYPGDHNTPKWSFSNKNFPDPISNKDAFTGFAGDAPTGLLKLSARNGNPAGAPPYLTLPHCVCIICGRRKTTRETYDCENCCEDDSNGNCEWCNRRLSYADECYTIQGGGSICYTCYEEDAVSCSACQEVIHLDDSICVGDNYYCEGCDNSFLCAWCEERRLDRASAETTRGEDICEDCASRHFVECDGCSLLVTIDDSLVSESGESSYCEKCAIQCPRCESATVDDDGELCNSCQEKQDQEESANQEEVSS